MTTSKDGPEEYVYRVWSNNAQRYVGPGLRTYGPAKTWTSLGFARNAIAQACRDHIDRPANYRIDVFVLEYAGATV